MKTFRHFSRYIMQEDMLQPWLTVEELMKVSADLKLGKTFNNQQKNQTISEILELLRLITTKDTLTSKLSGGERKRLSIALELVNNPPVVFLDEPTTGLDDMASSQCVSLLKALSEGGRTIICSIHTPSAKLFSMFNNTYILSNGICAYQGYGLDVVPYLENLGLVCPKHYNPADFVIEVCSGEYGDYTDKLISAAKQQYSSIATSEKISRQSSIIEPTIWKNESNFWYQFSTLLFRMWKQMYRDKNYLVLKTVLHIFLGIFVGCIFYDIGNDGARTIYNFGLFYCSTIFFLYIPLMPILLHFPKEIQFLKREYFNRWYSLKAYFLAMTLSTIPINLILNHLFLISVYFLSGQPLEFDRMFKYFAVSVLTAFVSESLGLIISSFLTVVNSMFVGPVISVPFMLLAVYGMGFGNTGIPIIMQIVMHFSYLRYSLEGAISAVFRDRGKFPCPETEVFCIFSDTNYFLEIMGFPERSVWIDVAALFFIYVLFRLTCYYLLRQRLSPNKTFRALHVIVRFVKSRVGGSR
ncbi:ATP-binding cassette subfamily G member 4-like isoform X2 [Onthophagus taurus]|nr:ATP-binding cassette sub-family G member 4-like isoform X2 [Onthophagus taurus]